MPIRVGILGCANIARRSLAPAFCAHKGFMLVAVASRTAQKAAEFASCFNARPCTYNDLVEARDIDLVYCPLPTGLHYEWVKKCLLSGKHVLCEKSLACLAEEAGELVELARARSLLLMESFQFRFHRQNIFAKSVLDDKGLGAIRQIVVRFGFPPFPDGTENIRYARSLGGGALLDAGAYVVKAATYFAGRQLSVRDATAWTAKGYEVDLGGSIVLEGMENVVVHAAYGFDNFYQCGYEIWGQSGVLKTLRAFTAPPGYPAQVIFQKRDGTETREFADDHFARLLDHVAVGVVNADIRLEEYEEVLVQARLMAAVRSLWSAHEH